MKKALILLIAILSFAIMFAVPLNEGLEGTTLPLEGMVQIGNEENTDLYLPLTTNFGYNYSQTIYLQSEINAPGQRIEKLYYQWNGFEAATYCNDWEIYIGHTNKTAFSSNSDWIPLANLTQVFNGVVNTPATPGWIEIVLTTPINFNNTDNLVIAVNETTPGRGCTAAAFYGTSFDTNRGLRVWNDSSAYNPASPDAGYLVAGIANIRIQFGDIPAAPIFSHSPASIAFALTKAGESSDAQNVTVTNTCGGTLTLSATDVSLAGTNALDFSFSAANLPTNLTASQSV
ncbi:MAG TPA: hypothetical protein PLX77_02905, partial [Candidatus Cloacimonadota bacterium]|nr:hypothetical protein [Candidatus Cloacimonadota bacterium]